MSLRKPFTPSDRVLFLLLFGFHRNSSKYFKKVNISTCKTKKEESFLNSRVLLPLPKNRRGKTEEMIREEKNQLSFFVSPLLSPLFYTPSPFQAAMLGRVNSLLAWALAAVRLLPPPLAQRPLVCVLVCVLVLTAARAAAAG